ncbi:MAG: cytochrome b N-terminal domain-containing protein [Acidobacteria bacterium]|nr:cytochrome b N-terminal domain-containing protein [Acidobacteriota bacterium]
MFARSTEWIEERLGLRPVAARVLDHPVPKYVTWLHCFGGLTFFTFLILVVTGVLMAFFYVPTPDHAHDSVQWFQQTVPFGTIIRNLHRWSAYTMVVLVFLHMLRVLVHGAYRKPREMNWVVGVVLLLTTLVFAFTGYLLPWDQKAYWATNVGINIAASTPILGSFLAGFLRGGPTLGALTLLRFYALHVFALPLVLVGGLLFHFSMVRKQGIARPL